VSPLKPSAILGRPLFTVGFKFIPAAFGNWFAEGRRAVPGAQQQPPDGHTGDSFVPIGSVGMAMTTEAGNQVRGPVGHLA